LIDEKISQLALKLMERYLLSSHLLILDAIIAATAIRHNLTLITGNLKHFKMIKGLNASYTLEV
jgi:predicted nucleic acid-binding protein